MGIVTALARFIAYIV